MKSQGSLLLALTFAWLVLASGCSPASPDAPLLVLTTRNDRVLLLNRQQPASPLDITAAFPGIHLRQVDAPASTPHPFLFVSIAPGNREVFALLSDGAVSNLSRHAAADYSPSLSPNGKIVAFLSERDYRPADPLPIEGPCAQCDVYVVKVDGTDMKRLTNFGMRISRPMWINDNSVVYSVSGGDSYIGPCSGLIYQTNTETGLTTQISRSEGECDPLPSPDGRSILYDCVADGDDALCLMQADGSNRTRLTQETGVQMDKSWSPDGRQIAWTRHSGDGMEVLVMDVSTRSVAQTQTRSLRACNPVWTPDGTQILFVAHCDGPRDVVYRMNPDGSNRSIQISQSSRLEGIVLRGWASSLWTRIQRSPSEF